MMYHHLFYRAQDPISSYTHYIGAVVSGIVLVFWCIYCGIMKPDLTTWISVIIFGLSLIALYGASSFYHFTSLSNPHHVRYRKLDHSMIYVLIAGSYTPFILTYHPQGLQAIIILWIIALIGIAVKLLWLNAPRWLYTGLYLLLGWSIVWMRSIFAAMPLSCTCFIALGGIAYTIGAVLYIIKQPNISSRWGFHEVFHLFILGGSLFHILAVTLFIL